MIYVEVLMPKEKRQVTPLFPEPLVKKEISFLFEFVHSQNLTTCFTLRMPNRAPL